MIPAATDPRSGAAEIADGVFVFTSGAYAMTSTVVLGERPGARGVRPALLIDPGYFPSEIERIAAFLEDVGAVASRIMLTHSDWDHVAGAARWPGTAVVASSEFPARVASDGERIERSLRAFDEKLYVRREPPFSIPEPASLAGSPSDLVWEGPRTHLLPAGGHTTDGLMALFRESGILACGDHLSDHEIPFVGDTVAAYRETLGAARQLVARGEARLLVPGHGDVCGPDGILERIDEDLDYLDRLERWAREVLRTVDSVAGILDRCDEVVFRKGWDNPDIHAEHRSNVARLARQLGAKVT
jgi:glyoxylase-like metal-dependent hydrolase (beta-lactamase superfamily II)